MGRRARPLGRHRRDLRAPHLRRRAVHLDAGARARAGRPLRRRQRRGQDLRHDRLAGRLDDRPADVVKAATNLQSHATSNVSNVSQARRPRRASPATSTAVAEMREAFDRRRPHDRARCSTRSRASTCPEPEGAFYAFPSFEGVLGRAIARPDAPTRRRAGRADPRRGRGGRRARRGVRRAGLRPAVLRARRRRPGRGRRPDADAARRRRPTERRPQPASDDGARRDLRRAAQGAPAPALHRRDAARHAGRARRRGTASRCPTRCVDDRPPRLSATDERGWFRFQRLYDIARSVLRDRGRRAPAAARGGGGRGRRRVGLAGDPGRPERVRRAVRRRHRVHSSWCWTPPPTPPRRPGVGIGVVVAANRTRHPLDARTLARLAAQYAGRGVVGFGLSNDERRGRAEDFAPAFRIAERAGLLLDPHGGELLGPASVRACLEELRRGPGRSRGPGGRGPRGARQVADRGVDARGVPDVERRPRRLPRRRRPSRCGAWSTPARQVALGADDPLLFGSGSPPSTSWRAGRTP